MHLPKRWIAFCSCLICSFSLATLLQAQKAADQDSAELEHYTLTVDKMTRYEHAFDELAAYGKAHPEIKAEEDEKKQDQSIADIERRVSAHPPVVAILDKSGMSAHEFVVFGMVLFQASFAAETAKQNSIPMAKMAAEAHIKLDNLTFVEAHKTELEARAAKMKESAAKDEKPTDK